MQSDPYRQLAQRLDSLPNGYPPSPDGLELKLLAKLFTPQEAELASHLRLTIESSRQIAERTGGVRNHRSGNPGYSEICQRRRLSKQDIVCAPA